MFRTLAVVFLMLSPVPAFALEANKVFEEQCPVSNEFRACKDDDDCTMAVGRCNDWYYPVNRKRKREFLSLAGSCDALPKAESCEALMLEHDEIPGTECMEGICQELE